MRTIGIAFAIGTLLAGAGVAQTAPPAAPSAAPNAAKVKPKVKAAPVMHSPESIECSKQADAKELQGQERIPLPSKLQTTVGEEEELSARVLGEECTQIGCATSRVSVAMRLPDFDEARRAERAVEPLIWCR